MWDLSVLSAQFSVSLITALKNKVYWFKKKKSPSTGENILEISGADIYL